MIRLDIENSERNALITNKTEAEQVNEKHTSVIGTLKDEPSKERTGWTAPYKRDSMDYREMNTPVDKAEEETMNNLIEVKEPVREDANMGESTVTNEVGSVVDNVEPEDTLTAIGAMICPAAIMEPSITMVDNMDLDERAVEDSDTELLTAMRRQGANIAKTNRMATLKCSCGIDVKVGIEVEKNGQRTIAFAQVYSDGTVSGIVRIPQSEMLMYMSADGKNGKSNRKSAQFWTQLNASYLGTLSSPEILDLNILLIDIIRTLRSIPVYDADADGYVPADLYRKVIDEVTRWADRTYMDKKNYHAIFEFQMSNLAASLKQSYDIKLTATGLAKVLNEGGFLYLTPSSIGYETRVSIRYPSGDECKEWCYCIYTEEHMRRISGLPQAKKIEE